MDLWLLSRCLANWNLDFAVFSFVDLYSVPWVFLYSSRPSDYLSYHVQATCCEGVGFHNQMGASGSCLLPILKENISYLNTLIWMVIPSDHSWACSNLPNSERISSIKKDPLCTGVNLWWLKISSFEEETAKGKKKILVYFQWSGKSLTAELQALILKWTQLQEGRRWLRSSQQRLCFAKESQTEPKKLVLTITSRSTNWFQLCCQKILTSS